QLSAGKNDEDAENPGAEHDADDAAGGREQQALDDQLTREVALARAEREADRELAPPRNTGREQQVSDVRARDQQHEQDRAEQDRQRRARGADDDFRVRANIDAVAVRELAR